MPQSCTEGTDNRMFDLPGGVSLMPEVTNYIRALGRQLLGGGPCDGGAGWALGLERLQRALGG